MEIPAHKTDTMSNSPSMCFRTTTVQVVEEEERRHIATTKTVQHMHIRNTITYLVFPIPPQRNNTQTTIFRNEAIFPNCVPHRLQEKCLCSPYDCTCLMTVHCDMLSLFINPSSPPGGMHQSNTPYPAVPQPTTNFAFISPSDFCTYIHLRNGKE